MHFFTGSRLRLAYCSALLLTAVAACSRITPEPESQASGCSPGSRLAGSLYGSLAADIDWQGPGMGCEGMRRPGGEGARLRFSGSVGTGKNERQLALILAMPYLVEGAVGNEQPTRVTLIEENQGRFFATQENDTCWSDIYEQERATSTTSGDQAYRIRGLLYCVAPVPELNGTGSVTLGDIEFDGRVSWQIIP